MVQKAQVRKAPEVLEVPDARSGSGSDRSMFLLIGVLAFGTLAFLVLAGWTLYQRYHSTPDERIANDVAVAWGAADPAALRAVYAPNAVIVRADGSKVVGIKAILADVRGEGSAFALGRVGDVSATSDGGLATFAYRYAGRGHGTGIAVLKIVDGRVIRQWDFETGTSTAPRPQGPPSAAK